ncbi:MAG: polyphosphate kinase 1, partial [Planctomycetota bacterium]
MPDHPPSEPTPAYINRDLSWLAFNQRVLEEGQDDSLPLLERCKFLAIVSSNLDEFVMVRLAELLSQRGGRDVDTSGLDGEGQLQAVREHYHQQVQDQYRCWREQLEPLLKEEGLVLVNSGQWNKLDQESLASHYRDAVEPTLTPLAVDPTRPFPLIANLALIIGVDLEVPEDSAPRRALVVMPKMPRLIALPGEAGRIALLEEVVEYFLHSLFPGHTIRATTQFRVTRDASLEFEEDSAGDFLSELEQELRSRGRGRAVRLEIMRNADQNLLSWMVESLGLAQDQVLEVSGPLDLSLLFTIGGHLRRPELSFPTAIPRPIAVDWTCPFAAIRDHGEQLLHHPYDSFDPVVEMVQRAASDPAVLAIKQTLYRVSGDSPIVHALVTAAHAGKQVTVLVELKARFDEAANIRWARRLEEAGAHVVYGLVGLKVHAKLLLIIRRDEDGLRRYCHLGTGNYNDKTARIYTDVS